MANKSMFTNSSGRRIMVYKDDIKSYHGTDYPIDNGTIIYFKDGSSETFKEPFSEVDAIFDL